jgi:ectoine hydroxylase-related dioxygenase (phytanoyl-CoA dioxygenase family)
MGSNADENFFDQSIHSIHVSEDARRAGKPSLEHIAEAVSFLHRDGIVLLENVVDTAHLDHLNSVLVPEALDIASNPNHHFNFGTQTRNMDQAPPPVKELMYRDVWANPFACAVLSAVLGPQPVVHYAMGNTALQADPSGRQPVHSDCEFDHPVFYPWAYVVNINLVDTSPANGATEFWPGSHHVSTPEAHAVDSVDARERVLQIKPELVEERRRHSPPIQPSTKKGSIIIRDMRLWHAGRPNLTPDPRVMLAFVVEPAWFQGKAKVPLPLAVKGLIDSWSNDIQFNAEWVDGVVDHKTLSSKDLDFGSGSDVLQRSAPELSRWPNYAPRWY